MEFLELREVVQGQARQRLDPCAIVSSSSCSLAGPEHEPHIEGMVAAVIVGDLGQGVDRLRHPVEIRVGHREGREGEASAQALGIEEGAEAAQQTVVEQLAYE